MTSDAEKADTALRWVGLRRSLRRVWRAGGLMGDGRPQPVEVEGAYPAVLALHGFGCVPNEVELVSSLARRLGLRCSAPLLPGHGTRVRDLARTRYEDWYAAAEQRLLELAERGPVIVAGQSLGGLLALDLASRHSQVCAVVVLANPLRLPWPFPTLALQLAALLNVPDFSLPKVVGPDIVDPVSRRQHLTYDAQPWRAAESLRQAALALEPRLEQVSCPAFLAHGALDRTTPLSNVWLAAPALAARDLEVHIFPNSGHILTKDNDRAVLDAKLEAFIRRCAAPHRA